MWKKKVKGFVTAAAGAVLAASLLMTATVTAKTEIAQEAVFDLRAFNILRGETDGDLRLEAPITRAEFSALVVRMLGWGESFQVENVFQDVEPEDWYRETMAGLKELLEGFDRSEVAGLSFGGQMHGLVMLDSKDCVIRPAILWNDGRTKEENDYLNNKIGKENLSKYTANISFTGFTAPKILWVKKNEPDNFAKISKIMLPKDYLAYRLTGVHCTDVSDASGMLLLNVEKRMWSKEMCDICGISQEMLPRLYESYECVGTILPETAAQLGLGNNVKVAAGAFSL